MIIFRNKRIIGKLHDPILKLSILLSLLLGSIPLLAQEQSITFEVNMENIRTIRGQIILDIYKNEASFEKETPMQTYYLRKTRLTNGKLSFSLSLPPGTYGIAMIDDENMNKKIDRTFIGFPKEGYGFSGMKIDRLRKPNFEEFSFLMDKFTNRVDIKVHYAKLF